MIGRIEGAVAFSSLALLTGCGGSHEVAKPDCLTFNKAGKVINVANGIGPGVTPFFPTSNSPKSVEVEAGGKDFSLPATYNAEQAYGDDNSQYYEQLLVKSPPIEMSEEELYAPSITVDLKGLGRVTLTGACLVKFDSHHSFLNFEHPGVH